MLAFASAEALTELFILKSLAVLAVWLLEQQARHFALVIRKGGAPVCIRGKNR